MSLIWAHSEGNEVTESKSFQREHGTKLLAFFHIARKVNTLICWLFHGARMEIIISRYSSISKSRISLFYFFGRSIRENSLTCQVPWNIDVPTLIFCLCLFIGCERYFEQVSPIWVQEGKRCGYTELNGIYTEEVLVSAYSRSWAVKLEQPEALSLDLHTVCNVSELYFDVKKMLRRHQGMWRSPKCYR